MTNETTPTAPAGPVGNEAAERPANRITVEEAKSIVDALNPGMPDEDEYDPEFPDWEDEA